MTIRELILSIPFKNIGTITISNKNLPEPLFFGKISEIPNFLLRHKVKSRLILNSKNKKMKNIVFWI